MHEISLVMSILDIVKETLTAHNASRVTKVTLVLGELACVEPKALSSCFEMLTQDTPVQGAELVFEHLEAVKYCINCEKTYTKLDQFDICQVCGGKISLKSGREFYLKSLELESDDTAKK